MTRQEALNEWRKIHNSIIYADEWTWLGGLVADRNKIREKYDFSLEELQTMKAKEKPTVLPEPFLIGEQCYE